MTMTFIEALQLMISTGVLTGGAGMLKWALSMERRVMKLEVHTGIKED